MTEVQIGAHDPHANDTSAADQPFLGQIAGEQQQANAQAEVQAVDQAATTFIGALDPAAGAALKAALQAEATAAVGHGYAFSPEQVDQLMSRANDLRERFRTYQQEIESFGKIDLAPAEDQAGSVMQANTVKASFRNLDTRIQGQIDFLSEWISTLTAVKQKYMQQERLTTEQWTRLTQGLSS